MTTADDLRRAKALRDKILRPWLSPWAVHGLDAGANKDCHYHSHGTERRGQRTDCARRDSRERPALRHPASEGERGMSEKWAKGPWRAVPYSSVVGASIMAQPDPKENSLVVAMIPGIRETAEANRDRIVACVNAFADSGIEPKPGCVKQLIDALWLCRDLLNGHRAARGPVFGVTEQLMEEAIAGADAALGEDFAKPWHPKYVRQKIKGGRDEQA